MTHEEWKAAMMVKVAEVEAILGERVQDGMDGMHGSVWDKLNEKLGWDETDLLWEAYRELDMQEPDA